MLGITGGVDNFYQMSDIEEEQSNHPDDCSDEYEDQDEDQLEKLRPQIILDQSAQQDRDDNFEQEDEEIKGIGA